MRMLREWLHRLWGTVGTSRRDEDLEEELRLHLDLAAEDAQCRGADSSNAARAARLNAGGATQAMEALRDQRGLPWLDDLVRDVRHGLRSLRRTPVLAAVAFATLAVGIGANVAMFSVMYAVLWRPLPYPADRVVISLNWRGLGPQAHKARRTATAAIREIYGSRPARPRVPARALAHGPKPAGVGRPPAAKLRPGHRMAPMSIIDGVFNVTSRPPESDRSMPAQPLVTPL